MSDGLLARWLRRKLESKEGTLPPDEPVAPAAPAVVQGDEPMALPAAMNTTAPAGPARGAEEPPLTLDDVKALTRESDFSRFAARHVAPEVRNAALKKLFADPRYNVMDGLDVYVGDYSRPDPIAPELLRRIAGARALGLFDEQVRTDEHVDRQARDDADNGAARFVADCHTATFPAAQQSPDADPDLRLQPDHADPGADPGSGAG